MIHFWTLYHHNGQRQFIAGHDLEDAYNRTSIAPQDRESIDFIMPRFDYSYVYKKGKTPSCWIKTTNPRQAVDLLEIAVNGIQFDKVCFATTTKVFLKEHRIKNHWIGGKVFVSVDVLSFAFRQKLIQEHGYSQEPTTP